MTEKFRLPWKNYAFQTFLATLSTLLVLVFLNIANAVVIAAIGVAIMGFTRDAMIGVATRVVVLSLAHHFLKPFLRKLM